MTKQEQYEQMLDAAMGVLRTKDMEIGAMDECYEPFNHLLSADENQRCWEYLAKQYSMNIVKTNYNIFITLPGYFDIFINEDEFYDRWVIFLQLVDNVVRYGSNKTPGIENIVNNSGISRETFVKFLD